MERRRCAVCGKAFRPRSQVPHQMYCSAAACQRARRWQRVKRRSDAAPRGAVRIKPQTIVAAIGLVCLWSYFVTPRR
jgi:hypothetical protein